MTIRFFFFFHICRVEIIRTTVSDYACRFVCLQRLECLSLSFSFDIQSGAILSQCQSSCETMYACVFYFIGSHYGRGRLVSPEIIWYTSDLNGTDAYCVNCAPSLTRVVSEINNETYAGFYVCSLFISCCFFANARCPDRFYAKQISSHTASRDMMRTATG